MTYREIDAAGVDEILSRPFPTDRDVSAHYSVDLTFRLLPDLYARAKAASRDDPFLNHIEQWANDWPLSSVGIAGVASEDIDELLRDDSLRILYVDRILARKDRARLHHPEVQDAVQRAYGMHDQLAPELHTAITATIEEANQE